MPETAADRKARIAAELNELEGTVASTKPPRGQSIGEVRHGHGACAGPDEWGIEPKGAEVDMPGCFESAERSRHRSPVTAPQGGH